MSTEMIIMMIGLGLGGHFQKALDESGKETFTKDDIILIHTKALTDFCENFSEKKKEEKQKNKEAELAELGILPKSGIS
jgi:hypothetical protein